MTRQLNPLVHRMQFSNILQGDTESIKEFVVRLRSAAVECEYTCPDCSSDLSPIRVLANSSLQTSILAKAGQLITLEDIIRHAEAFETAVHDQSQIDFAKQLDSPSVYGARTSDYKCSKTRNQYWQPNRSPAATSHRYSRQPNSCPGCGSNAHNSNERQSKCPAWGQECRNCGTVNHFAKVCRQFKPTVNSVNLIAHVHYDQQKEVFTNPTRPHMEEIHVTVSPNSEKFTQSMPTSMKVFPDSGASICIAGLKHLSLLNINRNELIGRTIIKCFGWLPVKFNVEGHTTTQPLYICDRVDRVYLSKSACLDTNILPDCFPKPVPKDRISHIKSDTPIKRMPPPPRPDSIPIPPIPENVNKLENYIRQNFSSSAFNRSAPFPSMSTKPAHIHLKANAVPYARHSPIPVAHHWKAEIKAGLYRDVENGIITPVPIGMPVEWCSPMVVVTKKNGSPRRTIDLQKLNSQCNREKHHCQPPFQLASQVLPNTKK